MSVQQKILEQLKSQVIELLDDLSNICNNDQDILMVQVIFSSIDPEKLMTGFIEWVYPWKNFILQKNEEFFEKNDHIFGPLPVDKVEKFKVKFKDGTFDNDDKETIWEYFNIFIKLIEKYNKIK